MMSAHPTCPLVVMISLLGILMLKKSLLASAMLAGLLAGPAAAADLFIPEVIIQPELFSWTTCYVGASVKYTTGTTNSVFPFSDYGTKPTGPGFSPRLGCDYQPEGSPFVVGIVTELSAQNVQAAKLVVAGPPAQTLITTMPWDANIRLRAGVAADKTLFYVTGGLAIASITNDLAIGAFQTSATNTHVGWTIGAGVEAMVTDNLSVFAEYLYTDLGTRSYTFPGANFGGGIDTLDFFSHNHTVKAGLNYHF